MENVKYWLWLQKALGYGANISDIIRIFGNARNVYEAGEVMWRTSGVFEDIKPAVSLRKINSLKSTELSDCNDLFEYCQRSGIDIITPESSSYPELLKRIKNYPAVLFVRGDLSCLEKRLPIAVIGTRKPSQYGIKTAEKVSEDLAHVNTVIVSGGALGIDSIAHKAAINNNGKTILVMGCGIDSGYLRENEDMRSQVSKNGAVISEYPPLMKGSLSSFPIRNRIISGISYGVVIIEAGLKSGTLNTASHARRQNRDIFAVPGDISSSAYQGSNKLILEGARPVFGAADILKFYEDYVSAVNEMKNIYSKTPFDGIDEFAYGEPASVNKKISSKKSKNKNPIEKIETEKSQENKILTKITAESVSENAFLVYNIMSDKEMALDEITRASALPVRKVLTSLTELELLGAVSSCGGNRYIRK